MSSPLFDELADRYGLRPAPPPPPPTPYARRPPPPLYPPPQQGAPPLCPRCSHADAPFGLVHRHLDEVVGYLITRINQMENLTMSALDNLTAQVANLQQTINSTVEPALVQLAAGAGGTTGVPEADVQAQADAISTAVSGLAAATQSALSQAGAVASPTPAG